MLCDFIYGGSGLEDESMDYAMFLIFFMPKNRKNFLKKLIVS